MTGFPKRFVSAFLVVLMISTLSVHAAGAQAFFLRDDDDATDSRVNRDGAMFFFPDVISNPTGVTSAGEGAPCTFPPPPAKTTFTPGESVWFNVYWADNVEADRVNVYNVTMAVQVDPDTLLIFFEQDFTITLTEYEPGTALEFCAAAQGTIPPTAPAGAYVWGARVIKLEDNTRVQQPLNTLTILP